MPGTLIRTSLLALFLISMAGHFPVSVQAGETQGTLKSLPTPEILLQFDNNLENSGSEDVTAETEGTPGYEEWPGTGKAYVFDGGDNPLKLPGYHGINGDHPRTVALWVNTNMDDRGVMMNWGESAPESRGTFAIQPAGFIRYEYQGPPPPGGWNAQTDITDGEWHHVAYTYDGDMVRIYVNGVEENVSDPDLELNTSNAGTTDVTIGKLFADNPQFFPGFHGRCTHLRPGT